MLIYFVDRQYGSDRFLCSLSALSASVNPTGNNCPIALKIAACVLLLEVTSFLREAYKNLPKACHRLIGNNRLDPRPSNMWGELSNTLRDKIGIMEAWLVGLFFQHWQVEALEVALMRTLRLLVVEDGQWLLSL